MLTVAQAKKLKEDTQVTLRGKIERHVGGENYLFRDASGSIEVEIDSDQWAGQTVAPQDLVEIFGKVEKHFKAVEIDVKKLRKL